MNSSCFQPIARPDARILILGSLPGQMSLRLGQYYGQPRNAFWRIMAAIFGFAPNLPYDERVAALERQRIAAWDVCASAFRPGSLDSNISQVVVNDFQSFFAAHPAIRLICFNGKAAENLYRTKVLPNLPAAMARMETRKLPSTSPANAGIPFEQKLFQWSDALGKESAGLHPIY
jgi:hypoxanthine-DNA glycosylase